MSARQRPKQASYVDKYNAAKVQPDADEFRRVNTKSGGDDKTSPRLEFANESIINTRDDTNIKMRNGQSVGVSVISRPVKRQDLKNQVPNSRRVREEPTERKGKKLTGQDAGDDEAGGKMIQYLRLDDIPDEDFTAPVADKRARAVSLDGMGKGGYAIGSSCSQDSCPFMSRDAGYAEDDDDVSGYVKPSGVSNPLPPRATRPPMRAMRMSNEDNDDENNLLNNESSYKSPAVVVKPTNPPIRSVRQDPAQLIAKIEYNKPNSNENIPQNNSSHAVKSIQIPSQHRPVASNKKVNVHEDEDEDDDWNDDEDGDGDGDVRQQQQGYYSPIEEDARPKPQKPSSIQPGRTSNSNNSKSVQQYDKDVVGKNVKGSARNSNNSNTPMNPTTITTTSVSTQKQESQQQQQQSASNRQGNAVGAKASSSVSSVSGSGGQQQQRAMEGGGGRGTEAVCSLPPLPADKKKLLVSNDNGGDGSPGSELYFSRNPRPVSFKPYTLDDYQRIRPQGYVELGKLKPDLNSEELVAKRANAQRIKEFSKNLKNFNKEVLQQQSKLPATNEAQSLALARKKEESSRERALSFAKNVPKPKPKKKISDSTKSVSSDDNDDDFEDLKDAEQCFVDNNPRLQELEAKHLDSKRQVEAIKRSLGM